MGREANNSVQWLNARDAQVEKLFRGLEVVAVKVDGRHRACRWTGRCKLQYAPPARAIGVERPEAEVGVCAERLAASGLVCGT